MRKKRSSGFFFFSLQLKEKLFVSCCFLRFVPTLDVASQASADLTYYCNSASYLKVEHSLSTGTVDFRRP